MFPLGEILGYGCLEQTILYFLVAFDVSLVLGGGLAALGVLR